MQSVLMPDGMVANLLGPMQGKRHNAGMLRECNLLNNLLEHSFNSIG